MVDCNRGLQDLVQQVPQYDLDLSNKIGEGSFGSVYRGRDIFSGAVVAAKITKLKKINY